MPLRNNVHRQWKKIRFYHKKSILTTAPQENQVDMTVTRMPTLPYWYNSCGLKLYNDLNIIMLSLSITKQHTIDVYGEWGYSSENSLTSALDGGELRASRPDRFSSGREPLYSLDRRLSGCHNVSGRYEKSLGPAGCRTPNYLVIHPVT
jgi:hypothetical protein